MPCWMDRMLITDVCNTPITILATELEDPNLINGLLLTLARTPELGPFLPAFNDNRKHKRRDVLTGLPLPDERMLH